jgi:hypothetical protein
MPRAENQAAKVPVSPAAWASIVQAPSASLTPRSAPRTGSCRSRRACRTRRESAPASPRATADAGRRRRSPGSARGRRRRRPCSSPTRGRPGRRWPRRRPGASSGTKKRTKLPRTPLRPTPRCPLGPRDDGVGGIAAVAAITATRPATCREVPEGYVGRVEELPAPTPKRPPRRGSGESGRGRAARSCRQRRAGASGGGGRP